MRAIILAAGFGNRMKPLTDNVHKTLLKIADKTILERIIDGIIENGITKIVLVLGYNKKQVEDFLLDKYKNIEFHFVENCNYRKTNNIYSLALAFKEIEFDEDILLIESDLIYEKKVIERIIKSPYKNVALVDKYRSGMDGTVVEIENNIITNVIPTHLQGEKFDFSTKYKTLNIYKFSKEFCKNEFKKMLLYYSETFDTKCYYELILGILIYMQREEIYAEKLNGEKWAEVDDPNDLKCAEFVFSPEKRYQSLKADFGAYWNYNVLDYCFIRNMYFPNSSILSEIKNNLFELMHNYGSKQNVLNQKLSYFLNYKKENLQLLNGASQIFPIIGNYFKGKKVLIPTPTFGEYTRVFENIERYEDNIGINIKEVIEKSKNQDVVVFVNPNNPTGSEINSECIYDFARNNEDKFIIVDESFIEFSKYSSIIKLLETKEQKNILVIKSLSKSLGVPGVRLGYIYTQNEKLMEYINKNIPIWNMNSIAEFMLEIMLKHKNDLKLSFKKTNQDREDFIKMLKEVPFIKEVYNSGANFILAKVNCNAEKLTHYFIDKYSIFLKDVSDKFNSNEKYLRFAVRLPEENSNLVELLKKYKD